MDENKGELNRLIIQGYVKPDCKGDFVEYRAYVNPAEVTFGYEADYTQQAAAGDTPGPQHFNRIKSGDLTVALFLDGTGANGRRIVVRDEIQAFMKATGYDGQGHEPRYLLISWGKLPVFRCRLKSASTVYKLFTPGGVPLRAVINATFTETVDPTTRELKADKKSADLTHVRLVKAGDTLPRLCQEIYGEPRMYIDVARANALDNFRTLRPGVQLRFPPLAK